MLGSKFYARMVDENIVTPLLIIMLLPKVSFNSYHVLILQNRMDGLAERKHHHIIKTNHTSLQIAVLLPSFWVEASQTTTYLINQMLTQVLQFKTPFQLLYNKKPMYDHLRVFGCTCYPWIPFSAHHKLDLKSVHCVFVGYDPHYKDYHCYNFNENISSFIGMFYLMNLILLIKKKDSCFIIYAQNLSTSIPLGDQLGYVYKSRFHTYLFSSSEKFFHWEHFYTSSNSYSKLRSSF